MRVAIVCPYDWSFPGGVRTHIIGLTEALGARGVETAIFAPSTDPAEQGIVRAGGTIPVPANGSVARLSFSPRAAADVDRLIREGEFSVVHLHEPAIPSLCLLIQRRLSIPSVATFHASRDKSLGYAIARPYLARHVNRLRARVAVSYAARALASRYFPGEYLIVPNGIDFRRFRGAEVQPEFHQLAPFVLFVGRDERRKGFRVAVDAVSELRRKLPVRLVAVGPSPSPDLPDWVHATGPLSDSRLAAVYRSAAAFMAPSLGGESFGIVLAEAMASDVPVVCSDLPGYREAALGAALFVRPGDAADLAARLEEVLTDQNLGDELRRRGSERAASLDWGVLTEEIVAIYRRAVS